MSGLERLRKLIHEHWPLPEWKGKSLFADELRGIADEMERDMRSISTQMWTQIEGKPVLDDEEEFTHWLERWYLPRPVDADGELFDFNKIYDNGCGAIGRIVATEFSIGGGKTSVIYDIVSHDESAYSPNALRAEKPDSIEKLRSDMCLEICGVDEYEANRCDCYVPDWLKRAEKLFKESGE